VYQRHAGNPVLYVMKKSLTMPIDTVFYKYASNLLYKQILANKNHSAVYNKHEKIIYSNFMYISYPVESLRSFQKSAITFRS
jgi:hypothetical protein